MLRVRCTCIGHRITHTCIPAAETIIRSTLPFRVRKSLHSREHFCFVVFLTCDRRSLYFALLFFFPFAFAFHFVKSPLYRGEWVLWWHCWFLFLKCSAGARPRTPAVPGAPSVLTLFHFFLFSFFFNLLPLPRSCLLVSSQHCSVPLNVLTIKHGERVLYLCSVFAEYENVSMQYQSDELRRVDQRQCKYLGVFSISPC